MTTAEIRNLAVYETTNILRGRGVQLTDSTYARAVELIRQHGIAVAEMDVIANAHPGAYRPRH
jgi:hypothetical protein